MDKSQLIHGILRLAHLLSRFLRIRLAIAAHETIQFYGTIEVEVTLQGIDITTYLREVEKKHLILALQLRRMLSYPELSKKWLKLITLVTVIVRVEHTQKYALAKATRTDEEEVTGLLLQLGYKHRLIDIIQILLHHRDEICHSVWYFLYFFHILFPFFVQRYNYFFRYQAF